MKICFAMNYHYSERVGGAEVQAWLLAKELVRKGYKVSYIAESLTDKAGTIDVIDGISVFWIRQRRYLDILNVPSYYTVLTKISPDVVIQRYTSLYTGVIGYYASRASIPYVWVSTDNRVPQRNFFVASQRETLKQVARPFLKRTALILNAVVKDIFRNYGMRYVTHPCILNSLQKVALRDNYSMEGLLLPSGHEAPKETPSSAEPPVILWVANMGRRKRPELFIELCLLCKDINAHFVMVGSHPDKIYLSSLLNAVISKNNFTWTGRLSFEETLRYFDMATLFINTSFSEGFPNTFIQAWLRGVPVISFHVDTAEIITMNNLGKVIGSPLAAKEAITTYLNMKDFKNLRDRIRIFAEKNYSISLVAQRFLEIISKPSTLNKMMQEREVHGNH